MRCSPSRSTGSRTSAMSSAPVRIPCSWTSSVTGTSSIGSRCRSRQGPAHLSGVAPVTKPRWKVTSLSRVQVEAVELHDLDPRLDEVADEPVGTVLARVDLGQRAELAVGAEHEVDRRRRPLPLAGREVADLVAVLDRL